MNYEKMSRAMRYHYGSEKKGRKGHLAMVKEKRLCYRLNAPSSIKRHENVKIIPFFPGLVSLQLTGGVMKCCQWCRIVRNTGCVRIGCVCGPGNETQAGFSTWSRNNKYSMGGGSKKLRSKQGFMGLFSYQSYL